MQKENLTETPGGPGDAKAVARFLRTWGDRWRVDFPEGANDDPTPAVLNKMAAAHDKDDKPWANGKGKGKGNAKWNGKGKGKAKATSEDEEDDE